MPEGSPSQAISGVGKKTKGKRNDRMKRGTRIKECKDERIKKDIR
jgi:hypothetical protein